MGRHASGSLLGLAYGDALGAPTEFQSYEQIVARYGSNGPRELDGSPAMVTDDTQMAIAVGQALLAADGLGPAALERELRRTFVAWWRSPDNTRAPGMTCLDACAGLARGGDWLEATVPSSKGCGANMRVAPVGLLGNLSDEDRAGIAQFQAALTHGHQTALAASDLTAFAVHWLRDGMSPSDLIDALQGRCIDQREVYHAGWLRTLWERPGMTSPEDFIARGWDECAAALRLVSAALASPDRGGDPCRLTGDGWVAEEALATALYCYLRSPDDAVAVVARGAATSGDSDSIACIAGAMAGASLGLDAWPLAWHERIEYADALDELGASWD